MSNPTPKNDAGLVSPDDQLVQRRDALFDLDVLLAREGLERVVCALVFLGAVAFALWHIATNSIIAESARWQNTIHFAGFALLAAITTRSVVRGEQTRWSLIANTVFGFAIAASSLWIAAAENGLYARTLAKTGQPWQFGILDWTAGFIVIFGVIELTRRLTGWIIPILVIVSLAYILFLGELMPGTFRAASLPLDDVLFRSLYNDEGMFGIITSISSANITLFMIFGALIEAVKHSIGTEEVPPIDRKKLIAGLLNFVLPLGTMTYLLVSGRTPSYAAVFAIGTLILVSWLTPNRMGPTNISRALAMGIKTSIMTAVLLVAVGLINNAVTTSCSG